MKRVILGFIGFMLLYGIFYFYADEIRSLFYGTSESEVLENFDLSKGVLLDVGDATIHAELALTNEEKTQGLSGRSSLPKDTGMLFVYTRSDIYKFWMPNMNFALDIVWFDSNFMVVDISRNVTPESFPETFSSRIPAQFVLEVGAGYAAEKGIEVGQVALLHQ